MKYGITVAPVLDIRSGFPLSVIDEDRNFVGPRNRAGRFPNFASLDLQVRSGTKRGNSLDLIGSTGNSAMSC
jgi:hypothetical protein